MRHVQFRITLEVHSGEPDCVPGSSQALCTHDPPTSPLNNDTLSSVSFIMVRRVRLSLNRMVVILLADRIASSFQSLG